jgi:integrase
MPRPRPTLFEVRYSEKPNRDNSWRVVGFINGTRKQYWFKSEKEAKTAMEDKNAEIAAYGTQVALSAADRLRAFNASERLAQYGKTIDDAVQHYLAHLEQTSDSISVSELCKIVRQEFVFRLANEGATLRHKRTMDSELKKFEARFGDRPIKALSGNEVKEWLAGLDLAPKTRIKIFGYIRNAYGIAVQKGLLETHPFEKVENFMRNKKSEAPPFPLTPEEAERLLNAAEPSVLPFIAIGMFAGLRTSERDEVEWKHLRFDDPEPYIDLPKSISKTGERRMIPIQPALMAFLAPFIKKQGRIAPLTCNGNVGYQNAWERSVKAAGLWPWSENRLRDSFCSYRYRATGSAEITSEEDGHSVQVMIDCYRKLVTKEAADRFWSIRP